MYIFITILITVIVCISAYLIIKINILNNIKLKIGKSKLEIIKNLNEKEELLCKIIKLYNNSSSNKIDNASIDKTNIFIFDNNVENIKKNIKCTINNIENKKINNLLNKIKNVDTSLMAIKEYYNNYITLYNLLIIQKPETILFKLLHFESKEKFILKEKETLNILKN